MMCLGLIAAASLVLQAVSPQQLARSIFDQTKLPVVIEWAGERTLPAIPRAKDEPLAAWVNRLAKRIDREAVMESDCIVLRATWVPSTLRQYDQLAIWSVEQKRPEPDDYKEQNGRKRFVHTEGCSSSPAELAASGLVKWKTIDPPYRDYRFVCFAPAIEAKTLAKAVALCFGADAAESEKHLLIDPKALRTRRRVQAERQLAKTGPLESDVVSLDALKSQIEVIALNQMSDKIITSLYKRLQSDHTITVESGTSGFYCVMRLWDLLCKLEQRAGRDPEKVRKNSLVQMWATGKGTFGGRLEREDGYGIYF